MYLKSVPVFWTTLYFTPAAFIAMVSVRRLCFPSFSNVNAVQCRLYIIIGPGHLDIYRPRRQ